MKRVGFLLLVALPLASLLAPSVSAADSTRVVVTFETLREAGFTWERTWEGEDANRARAALDEGEGNGDGIWTIPEERRFLAREGGFPSAIEGFGVNRKTGERAPANVTLEGALGYAVAPQPVRLLVEADVVFRSLDESRPAHALNFQFDGPGTLRAELPEGWRAKEVHGFDEARILEAGEVVEGRAPAGTEVRVILVREDALPSGSQSSAAPRPGARDLPGLSLVGVLSVAAAMAYGMKRVTGGDDGRGRQRP